MEQRRRWEIRENKCNGRAQTTGTFVFQSVFIHCPAEPTVSIVRHPPRPSIGKLGSINPSEIASFSREGCAKKNSIQGIIRSGQTANIRVFLNTMNRREFGSKAVANYLSVFPVLGCFGDLIADTVVVETATISGRSRSLQLKDTVYIGSLRPCRTFYLAKSHHCRETSCYPCHILGTDLYRICPQEV
ncbi:hypothetical protein PENTCL1PPCAC_21564 [Pristionchus entomophagus]|uniref:Uncharacterized protein n=1 Tax=Pristionchus entomophagus TaxID=358040 RepID=A0AAV5TY32_9BILA|nr:hypothetical protein PENTCL1PPCAC_21564 [Pristionchus entomophagus]